MDRLQANCVQVWSNSDEKISTGHTRAEMLLPYGRAITIAYKGNYVNVGLNSW